MKASTTLFTLIFLSAHSLMAEESVLESAPVIDTVTYQVDKNRLVIQRIEEPDPTLQAAVSQSSTTTTSPEVGPQEGRSFQITATTYEEKGTRFQIRLLGPGPSKDVIGWSNLDWSLFTVRHQLIAREQRHRFLFFHSKVSLEALEQLTADPDSADSLPEVPALLPTHASTGSRYLLTSSYSDDTPQIETILDFLEALHTLYDEQRAQLEKEQELVIERGKERKRQILLEKNKPQTQTLRIWRLKDLEEKGESE